MVYNAYETSGGSDPKSNLHLVWSRSVSEGEHLGMADHRFVFGTLLALAPLACGGAEGEGTETAEAAEFHRVVNVEVETVAPRPYAVSVRVTGMAAALRDVVVAADETGVVSEILAEQGSEVELGAPILKLDDEILRAQHRVASARAEYDEGYWERTRRLYEESGIGSEVAYLQAKRAAEESAGNLAVLETRLAHATVRVPFDGILDSRLVEVGSFVAPGTPVAREVQIDTIKVLAGVPARFAALVGSGTKATAHFGADEMSLSGTVAYAGATVDLRTRTMPIELTFPNPGRRIKAGGVADVVLTVDEVPDALVLPRMALISMEEGQAVFAVSDSGEHAVAEARQVRVASWQGNEVVVESGVAPGDRVVVVGQRGLTHGDWVRVVTPPAASAGTEGK